MAYSAEDNEKFVRIWQMSNCVKDVCKQTGLAYTTVTQRAVRFREKGVPLKSFKAVSDTNWQKLAKIAEDLQKNGDDNQQVAQ